MDFPPRTNAKLQSLKPEQERVRRDQDTLNIVRDIYHAVTNTALRGDTKVAYNNIQQLGDPTSLLAINVMERLLHIFPEAKIDYIPQNKLTGGRAVLMIDWS